MTEVHISVRNLVEFILRSGDIDNRKTVSSDNAMQEGSRIHRMIQRRMGADYHAEVPLTQVVDADEYQIVIEGRADGIIKSTGEELVTIDEIKGTYRDIHKMKAPVEVHLAQAKCYAYIYGSQNRERSMRVRMTYCNIDTEEYRYFHFEYGMKELKDWFEELLAEYRKWADFQFEWQKKRTQSIKSLGFPFEYRSGQKELVTYVYQTIYHKRKLYIEAPTGVGKTISTIFPAVKAMGEGLSEKIFYLTAKTITRTVADQTFSLLRDQGMQLKTVILTARDKICPMEESNCNPEYCPYAKGHFDRINDAMYTLLTEQDNYTREILQSYSEKFQVCPFEFGLDMSLFSDAVIGDYNYLFDPHVYLRRFFSEGIKKDYIFLIDEAHNLVERGREMYSAVLKKEDFLTLKKVVKEYDGRISARLDKCNKELLSLKRHCEDYYYESQSGISAFVRSLDRLSAAIEDYLEDHEDSPVKTEILEFYFQVSHFLMIHENMDRNYEIYTRINEEGNFLLKLLCVNPTENLKQCMQRGRSSILFSATLLPIQYYKKLLGAEEGDYEVYAKSVFEPEKRGIFIAQDVTSKYTRRSEKEYDRIASYIAKTVKQKKGNYMVFFPSYVFLENVAIRFQQHYKLEDTTCIFQGEYMDEEDREQFLMEFENGDPGSSLIAFCVLGGIFSEGIDLKKDSLIGALIVGTGLPLVWCEKEILKTYFDDRGESGFDYAYRFPGMNKVLQAAGRVIRTVEDIGIVVLLDERFLTSPYLKLFPREWNGYKRVTLDTIGSETEKFWNTCKNEYYDGK